MLTQRLAEFVIGTRTRDLPDPVLDRARHAVIDTVGCALAGTLEPVGDLALRWVNAIGGRPQATVWGHALKTSPAEAAFANGMACHALDFDDSLPNLRGHPSTTMVPAAMAVAEVAGASGEDLLAAYAIGLEVAGTLGRAVGAGHYVRGWHATATIGVFSATAAAARLWGLDAAQLQVAWGLAASQVSGLVQNFGTMTKPFHAGNAARAGVLSAWMAREGFTANPAIFDGKASFFSTYGTGDGADLGPLLEQLGNPWEIVTPGIYVKRWPCCYCNHRPLGGLLKLIEAHDIKADEVESCEIGFVTGSDNALISTNPQTGLEGKFSIEYVAAAALLDRKLVLETFTDPMVQRPAIRALIPKMRRYRIDDGKVYSSKFGYSDVAVTTPRGRFAVRVDLVSGSPEWPMTEPEINEKFLGCAGHVLGERGAQLLLGLLQRMRTLSDVCALTRAAIPAAAQPATNAASGVARSA